MKIRTKLNLSLVKCLKIANYVKKQIDKNCVTRNATIIIYLILKASNH